MVRLIATETFEDAKKKIYEAQTLLEHLAKITAKGSATISGAQKYIQYLVKFWITTELWQSWSQFGRIEAAKQTGIPLKYILLTTNHLEAFNRILKRKYIHRYQRGGRRIRFDLLIVFLITGILPSVFSQRRIENEYSAWLSNRFMKEAGGVDLTKTIAKSKASSGTAFPVTWWTQESDFNIETMSEIKRIINKGRIHQIRWKDPLTVTAMCVSSLPHTNPKEYCLELHCHGHALCSCPFNQSGKGACKHLWALRLILPQLHPSILFHFPSTQSEALNISESFGLKSIADPPTNELSSLAMQLDALVDIGVQSSAGADADDSSDTEENSEDESSVNEEDIAPSPLLDPFIYKSNTSATALEQQKLNCLDQELSIVLPRLHGLHLLLKDISHVPMGNHRQITELETVVQSIQSQTS